MAKRTSAVFARQGYHHGNLKEALIEAARRLIAERGPNGFMLNEAAKVAGVSAAAPYRHFKDRDALIATVAERGFAAFGVRLAAAWSGAEADPLQAFAQMGKAYLAFAREEPGFYGAMFAHGGGERKPPDRKGDSAFAALQGAIARVAASGKHGDSSAAVNARALAYQVWALSHGIATLAANALIPTEPTLRPEDLLRTGAAALIAAATRPEPIKPSDRKRGGKIAAPDVRSRKRRNQP